MVLSILYGKKYQQGRVGSISLDVTVREDHKFASRVTTYPIEEGSTLSDHIINEPDILVLEGIVTDTPIGVLSLFNRSVDVFNRLIELHERREIVDVVTGLRVYNNMAITNMEVPREIRTGQALRFIIELQEVIIDTSVRLEINEEILFGGVQSKIPREIVSTGENIPYIQNDPLNSLKDQATSGTDFGIQSLVVPPPNVGTKIQESTAFIYGLD